MSESQRGCAGNESTLSWGTQYIVLAQKAMGNLEGAKKTVARAVLYETPSDDDKRQETFKLYKEVQGNHGIGEVDRTGRGQNKPTTYNTVEFLSAELPKAVE